MVQKFLRPFVVVLSLLAFVAAGLSPAMADMAMRTNAVAMSTASDDPMPCCPEKAASCVTDVGCVFLVGLPMPPLTVSTALGWSLLRYDFSHDRADGLSIQPALGPPILSA